MVGNHAAMYDIMNHTLWFATWIVLSRLIPSLFRGLMKKEFNFFYFYYNSDIFSLQNEAVSMSFLFWDINKLDFQKW